MRITHLYFYVEPRDGIAYHMCTELRHVHYIPLMFSSCYEEGCWTWEMRFSK